MAQRQLEASYRPLLIDVVPSGPVSDNDAVLIASQGRINVEFPGGHSEAFDPRQIYIGLGGGRINLAVPLRNVGNGVAAILPALIWVVGQRIGAMEGCNVQSKLVPPGETTRIVCAPRLTQLEIADYPWSVILHVPYQDFAGGQVTIAESGSNSGTKNASGFSTGSTSSSVTTRASRWMTRSLAGRILQHHLRASSELRSRRLQWTKSETRSKATPTRATRPPADISDAAQNAPPSASLP
jgi:hypothetical protein